MLVRVWVCVCACVFSLGGSFISVVSFLFGCALLEDVLSSPAVALVSELYLQPGPVVEIPEYRFLCHSPRGNKLPLLSGVTLLIPRVFLSPPQKSARYIRQAPRHPPPCAGVRVWLCAMLGNLSSCTCPRRRQQSTQATNHQNSSRQKDTNESLQCFCFCSLNLWNYNDLIWG